MLHSTSREKLFSEKQGNQWDFPSQYSRSNLESPPILFNSNSANSSISPNTLEKTDFTMFPSLDPELERFTLSNILDAVVSSSFELGGAKCSNLLPNSVCAKRKDSARSSR